MTTTIRNRIAAFLLVILLFPACTPLIGPHSPRAYENATSLKVETLALMEKAKEPFDKHSAAIEALQLELKKAHEYVRGVPGNSLSARQWQLLIDENGALLGKFIRRWRERSTLGEVFITEFKGIVSDAFDEIICLEANKKAATRCGTGE